MPSKTVCASMTTTVKLRWFPDKTLGNASVSEYRDDVMQSHNEMKIKSAAIRRNQPENRMSIPLEGMGRLGRYPV